MHTGTRFGNNAVSTWGLKRNAQMSIQTSKVPFTQSRDLLINGLGCKKRNEFNRSHTGLQAAVLGSTSHQGYYR